MDENILRRIPGQMPEPHLRILRATVDQSLPAQIAQNDTEFSYDALAELIGAGYMEAKRHARLVNPCFYNIKITFAGRQILAKLQQTKPDHAADPANAKPPGAGKYKHEWHKRPILILCLMILGGVLVLLVAFLVRQHSASLSNGRRLNTAHQRRDDAPRLIQRSPHAIEPGAVSWHNEDRLEPEHWAGAWVATDGRNPQSSRSYTAPTIRGFAVNEPLYGLQVHRVRARCSAALRQACLLPPHALDRDSHNRNRCSLRLWQWSRTGPAQLRIRRLS